MEISEIPDPVRDDAPEHDQFDLPEQVDTRQYGLVAVDYNGERYCMECANPEYVDLARREPREIPYGGPVPEGTEVDCPGHSCGHCHRHIGGMILLHYDGVCYPDSCPKEGGWVAEL